MAKVNPSDRQKWIEEVEAGTEIAKGEIEGIWESADALAGIEEWGADVFHHLERALAALEQARARLEEGMG